jgi:ribonuclease-3
LTTSSHKKTEAEHSAVGEADADIVQRIQIVEELTGHCFSDKKLVRQAITHPSAVDADPRLSYERLEFLGDAVVGMCVAEYAYRRWPDLKEGDLTKMRVAVVNGSFLAEKQAEMGFPDLIIFGASEMGQSSRGMNSALEDTFESLVGALYLDAGYEVACRWVIDCLGSYVNPSVAQESVNPKSELQEIVQRHGATVEYRIIDSHGPAHAPSFTAEVLIEGRGRAQASGTSKKEAEAAAAAKALRMVQSSGYGF